MNDEVSKDIFPVIGNTLLRCGAAVAVVAALTFAAIIFHLQIVEAASDFRDFLVGPFADAIGLGCEFLGKMHYSAYLVPFFAYVWISCAWWKLKSVPGIRVFAGKIHWLMVLLGVINWFLLLSAIKYQPSEISSNFLILLIPLSVKLLLIDIYELYAPKA